MTVPKSDDGVRWISGTARPGIGLRTFLRPGMTVEQAVDHEVAVDALARLLTEKLETCKTKDGRVDMRDVAHAVLAELGKNQNPRGR